ncbi:MAG: hypothetical protein J5625_04105 [Lachnospiraceae bacterium]|jgi:hypothetical protein|nr:hypothetical protein [Lachnospiraceae bacterium]
MLLSYNEAIEQYGNAYKLAKAVADGSVFKIEDGIYSTKKHVSELGIIMKKYPKAVLTGEYAFYVHGLTNLIPEKYDIATPSKSAKLSDNRIKQIYVKEDIFNLGIEEKEENDVQIRIYDKERMLIELLRAKNSMPYDLYKEIIVHYREIIYDLEIWRIQQYASVFPKSKMISKALDEEVL